MLVEYTCRMYMLVEYVCRIYVLVEYTFHSTDVNEFSSYLP